MIQRNGTYLVCSTLFNLVVVRYRWNTCNSSGDECCDTPPASNRPIVPLFRLQILCRKIKIFRIMIENHMDYAYDHANTCRNTFYRADRRNRTHRRHSTIRSGSVPVGNLTSIWPHSVATGCLAKFYWSDMLSQHFTEVLRKYVNQKPSDFQSCKVAPLHLMDISWAFRNCNRYCQPELRGRQPECIMFCTHSHPSDGNRNELFFFHFANFCNYL